MKRHLRLLRGCDDCNKPCEENQLYCYFDGSAMVWICEKCKRERQGTIRSYQIRPADLPIDGVDERGLDYFAALAKWRRQQGQQNAPLAIRGQNDGLLRLS